MTRSWLAAPFSTTGGTNITSGSYAVGGTTLTATRSNSDTVGTPSVTTGVTTSQTFGNITGLVAIARNTNSTPQTSSITLNFNPAVSKLSFTLTDIDSFIGPDYREQVNISWVTASGNPVPTYTPGSLIESSGVPNTYRQITNDTNCGTNDTACNLLVEFCGGRISQLTILTSDLNPDLGAGGRAVFLGPLTFCV